MQLDAIPLIEKLFCEVNPIPVKKALNLMGWQAGPSAYASDRDDRSTYSTACKKNWKHLELNWHNKGSDYREKGLTGVSISSFCAIQEFVKRYTRKWR